MKKKEKKDLTDKELQKIVENGYNKIAEEYMNQRDLFDIQKELKEFMALIPEKGTILDVGCGGGIPVAKKLFENGFQVTGIDISENMLSLAKKNVPEVKFLKMDMKEINFDEKTFDGITSTYAIFHIPRENHKELFKTLHSILKDNGVILVSMGSSKWEEVSEFYDAPMYWSHYKGNKNREIVEQSGFEIIFAEDREHGGETHYWILARKNNE